MIEWLIGLKNQDALTKEQQLANSFQQIIINKE